MIIMKVSKVGYISNDTVHTVAYKNRCMIILGNRIEKSIEGHDSMKSACVDSFETGLKVLSIDLIDSFITYQGVKSKDFYFEVEYIETDENGLFWPSLSRHNKKYNLSTLEEEKYL